MLTTKNLSFRYPHATQAVLEDISLSLPQGTITALLGPSGSGKTTLLKCLAMLERPSHGTVTIDEKSYTFPRTPDSPAFVPPWPQLTVVFQQLFLWPHLTLRQNILLPVKNKGEEAKRNLQELTDLFHMGSFLDRYPNETSRGQQQRAALARALMLQPRYILCDEITSALDVEQISNVLECLQKAKEKNVGILLITHQLNFARRSADQILFLDNRRIIEQGGKECLTSPRTARFAEFLNIIKVAS